MATASLSSCISFDSYIKPQQGLWLQQVYQVVYLLIPTSNHNYTLNDKQVQTVVYLLIPTSNHNVRLCWIFHMLLYIF